MQRQIEAVKDRVADLCAKGQAMLDSPYAPRPSMLAGLVYTLGNLIDTIGVMADGVRYRHRKALADQCDRANEMRAQLALMSLRLYAMHECDLVRF